MNDSSRLMDQIGKVGNQMSTLQAFKSLQQDRTDAFNNALRHTESVVQSVTGLTGGGLLMKAADPVIQKLGIFQKSTAAGGASEETAATGFTRGYTYNNPMYDAPAAAPAESTIGTGAAGAADSTIGAGAAGAADLATTAGVGGDVVAGALGTATQASAAFDWNPAGLAATAVLGLGTILAGVFGHKKEESVPRHSPDQPTVANVSTQFGV